MESERKIEKWLRAYAKKRRGQAGDSFKLDSATRRILQNEISRSAPSSEDDDETMSLWELLRRHWMFFLGFATCIFILASIYFQSVKKANSKLMASNISTSLGINKEEHGLGLARQQLTKREAPVTNAQAFAYSDNARTAAPAVGAGEPSPRPVPNSAQIAARAERPPTVFSQNISGGIKVTNMTLRNSTPPSQPTIALAENSPPPAPVAPPSPATPKVPSGPAEAQTPAPQPETATSSPANGMYAVAPGAPSSARENPEANSDHKIAAAPVAGPAAQNMFMNTVAPPAQSASVLMNFHVVQNGNIINVVDQDGSVYRGMLHAVALDANAVAYNVAAVNEGAPAAAGTSALNATTKKVESPRMAGSDMAAPNPPPVEKRHWWHFHWPSWSFGGPTAASIPAASTPAYPEALPVPDNSAVPAPAVYSFRVGGMNRTLNQPVIFTATLVEDLNLMKPGQTNQAGQLQWSSLLIAGMAVVNGTNQIQINAKPVTPVKNGMPPNQ